MPLPRRVLKLHGDVERPASHGTTKLKGKLRQKHCATHLRCKASVAPTEAVEGGSLAGTCELSAELVEKQIYNRGRLEAFPDDSEDQVKCGEMTYVDGWIITTIVKERTQAETFIACVFRILAEAGWVVNMDKLEAIAVARGGGSRKMNADIKKEKMKLKLPRRIILQGGSGSDVLWCRDCTNRSPRF